MKINLFIALVCKRAARLSIMISFFIRLRTNWEAWINGNDWLEILYTDAIITDSIIINSYKRRLVWYYYRHLHRQF